MGRIKKKEGNPMKQRFKPYNKRKPFKMKSGGGRFMLGGGSSKFEFPLSLRSKVPEGGLTNLINLILGQRGNK